MNVVAAHEQLLSRIAAGHGNDTFRLEIRASAVSKSEVKGRAFRRLPFSPNASAMALDNALYGCQADAKAGEISLRVKPLEWDEKFISGRHIETRAVVPDKIDGFIINPGTPELYFRRVYFAGKFPGIPQKIIDHNTQHCGVS
jgi:hypothetical protein